MAPLAPDPWTQVYEVILSTLGAYAPLTDLVLAGNLINLSALDPDPYKKSVNARDLPELVVEPAGGEVNFGSAARRTQIDQDYDVLITTGDLRVDQVLFPVRYVVAQALYPLTDSRAGGGLPTFCNGFKLTQHSEEKEDPENRGHRGWHNVVRIETQMHIDHANMS